MDSQNRLNAAEPVRIGIKQAVIKRHERRLPVVAVDNIRLKVEVRQHFKHGTGEKRKALGIVVMAVKPMALKIILVVNQVINHVARVCFKHTAVLPAPCHRNGKARDELHVFTQFLRDILIQRKNDAAAD